MSDLVKMKAKTTFRNDRIRGGVNGMVSDGDHFETDPNHARDLARLGLAEPVSGSIIDVGVAPLEPHHTVSMNALLASRELRLSEADSSSEMDALAQRVDTAREKAGRDIAEAEGKAAERLEAIGQDLATAERQRDERLRALAAEVADAEARARTAIDAVEASAAEAEKRAKASIEAAEARAADAEAGATESKKRRSQG